MNYQIEIQRNDVTLAEFINYVKNQCAKKGIDFYIDRDEFENPSQPGNSHYYVKDGVKHCTYDGYTSQHDASDAACKSETLRVLPYDYQCYILNHDGSCYNEICEFTFDDDKRGHGYYYQINTDAREQGKEQQKTENGDDGMIDSFEKVWEEIGGEGLTRRETLEALQEEISKREKLGSQLRKEGNFSELTKVEQERDAFIQTRYGLQDLPYLGTPERLKERGLEESDIWKAARAKGQELEMREEAIDAYAKDMERRDQLTEAEEKAYEKSHKLNADCAQKLEEVLNTHYKDGKLDADAVLKDMADHNHGIDRISLVLANTITAKEMSLQGNDERYSSEAKEWAKNVKIKNFFHKDETSSLLHSGESIKSADSNKVMAFAEALQTRDALMTQNKEAELLQANRERAEAQKGQELVSEASTVPRGLDFNLPNADLSGVQESVIAASDKARTQVNDLRASASAREGNAGTDKLAAARDAAKKQLGNNAIVTSAVSGRTYSGKIIGIIGDGPDKTAVQVISGNRAILHDIKNISAKSNIKVGEDVSLTADEQGYSVAQSQSKGAATNEKYKKKNELTREGLKR